MSKEKHNGGKNNISLDNFDPRGPRDRAITSPRSLKACQMHSIDPEDLFFWNEDEFYEKLEAEAIETDDPKASYKQYLEEMDQIITQLKSIRQDIITSQTKSEKSTKEIRPASKKDSRSKGVSKEPQEKSSDVGQKSKKGSFGSRKLRNSREERLDSGKKDALQTSSHQGSRGGKKKKSSTQQVPSEDMMKQFQQTQFLTPHLQTEQSESRKDQSSYNQSRKVHEMEIKEKRREVNLLQANERDDNKKQRLIRKILNDNLRAKKLQVERDERKRTKEKKRIYEKFDKERAQNQREIMQLYKAHEIEARRNQKDQLADIHVREINKVKQLTAIERQALRDQKHLHVMNLKDVEEFRRGLAMADIALEQERVEKWRKVRELEKQRITEAARKVDQQRLQTQEYLNRLHRDRDRKTNLMKEQIQNEEGMIQLARALYEDDLQKLAKKGNDQTGGRTNKTYRGTKKKVKARKKLEVKRKETNPSKSRKRNQATVNKGEDTEEDKLFSKQIQEFKEMNNQEIMRLLQGKYY
jgi:hypothetical protein